MKKENPALFVNPSYVFGVFIPDFLFEMSISSHAILCYGKLARLAQKNGYAFLKLDSLSEFCDGKSKPTVIGYLEELKTAGLITVKRTGRASHYFITAHEKLLAGRSKRNLTSKNRVNQKLSSEVKETLSPYNNRTEQEKYNNHPGSLSGSKPLRPRSGNKATDPRRTSYPAGFAIDEQTTAWCQRMGRDPADHLDQFRDHHLARGTKFVDWTAAFRTWISNNVKWSNDKKPQGRNDSQSDWVLD